MFLNTDFLHDDKIRLALDKTIPGNELLGFVPSYRFFIEDNHGTQMGICDLRVGYNENTYYGGNIGYRIYEEFRGHRYAERASKLLIKLAEKHKMPYLIITCNPDNIPSRKTIERAGGKFIEKVPLPADSLLRFRGETEKLIYRVEI